MPDETEMKFAVSDHDAVRGALRAEGAEYLGEVCQTDRFFDTADHAFRAGDRGLRIRSVERLDGDAGAEKDVRPLVTYKGPRRGGGQAKVRPEHETFVGDAETLAKIFAACGLEPTLVLQKRRASYRLGDCLVELDELPVLGRFVEIEGPDEPAVQAVRDRLGLAREPVGEPYAALAANACRELETCGELTFRTCPGCDRRG